MAKLLKLRRGTTSQHSSFTGAEGEVTVDTTKDTLVVHDGSTAGGIPLAKESAALSLIDEDNMASNSATRPPSQQSVKAYVDAGDATVPTTITVADESTDTSCNVAFFTGATGDLAPKTGTNLTFNSDTGILTATGFSGPITGNVTGDVTGNVTGNASGTALTVTQAAQAAITSVGTLTAINIDGPYRQVAEAVGGTAIDTSTGNYFTKTISGNTTFTFTNPAASGTVTSFTLELTHSSGTVTWPSEVKWNTDTAPSLTTGKTHLFMFVSDDNGSRWRGSVLVDYVN
mgnify:FL=1|tara:strand:- start:3765 stop:4625 length:861 start_codon:yes stop_codon:yes gene_type:complete